MRLLFAFVTALALAGCSGSDPLSDTQRAFLTARGDPIAFTVAFADQELDPSGLVVDAPARRVDVWMYAGAPARRVVFDDGFFVEEATLGGNVGASALDVSPGDFTHGTSRGELERLLGPPDRVETDALGTRDLEVLRWDRPEIVSVAFVDGRITSVVAGLQVQP